MPPHLDPTDRAFTVLGTVAANGYRIHMPESLAFKNSANFSLWFPNSKPWGETLAARPWISHCTFVLLTERSEVTGLPETSAWPRV